MDADWILWVYPLTGMASIVPFARYFRAVDKDAKRKNRHHNEDTPLFIATMGWLCSLAWPITGLVFGTAYLLRADDRKELAAQRQEMGLAEAFKIVEAQKQAEKDRHRQQIAAFDKALRSDEEPVAEWSRRTNKAPYPNGWNKGRY